MRWLWQHCRSHHHCPSRHTQFTIIWPYLLQRTHTHSQCLSLRAQTCHAPVCTAFHTSLDATYTLSMKLSSMPSWKWDVSMCAHNTTACFLETHAIHVHVGMHVRVCMLVCCDGHMLTLEHERSDSLLRWTETNASEFLIYLQCSAKHFLVCVR